MLAVVVSHELLFLSIKESFQDEGLLACKSGHGKERVLRPMCQKQEGSGGWTQDQKSEVEQVHVLATKIIYK